MLSPENLKKLDELRKRFPNAKPLTLPVLWMIQKEHGWISPEAMRYVAGLIGVPLPHVYGVVTFYTMFNTKPVGKYHLQVCTNVSCMLRGGDELRDHLCRRLGIAPGETTPDSRFTVTEVECLGSCGTAPMMQVNDAYHENLSAERLNTLLAELR
jgi:NADH-quinone oxidoreductase subunit E